MNCQRKKSRSNIILKHPNPSLESYQCKPKNGNDSVGPDGTYLFSVSLQVSAVEDGGKECGGGGGECVRSQGKKKET